MRRLAVATITLAALMSGAFSALADSNIGWLDVTTTNPVEAAAILIDKADTRLVTPQKHMTLTAGHHDLTLRTKDGRTSSIGFSITADKTTSLSLHPH